MHGRTFRNAHIATVKTLKVASKLRYRLLGNELFGTQNSSGEAQEVGLGGILPYHLLWGQRSTIQTNAILTTICLCGIHHRATPLDQVFLTALGIQLFTTGKFVVIYVPSQWNGHVVHENEFTLIPSCFPFRSPESIVPQAYKMYSELHPSIQDQVPKGRKEERSGTKSERHLFFY